MIVLHAAWVGDPLAPGKGRLYFWGEAAERALFRRRGRPPRRSSERVPAHPFGAEWIELQRVLTFFGVQHDGSSSWPAGSPERLVVVLPSGKAGPLSSSGVPSGGQSGAGSRAAGKAESGVGGPEPSLLTWVVDAAALPPDQALEVLLELPDKAGPVASGVFLGADAIYWGRAARLVLELLIRQRLLPGVGQRLLNEGEGVSLSRQSRSGPVHVACWRPAFNISGDAERVSRLVAALPPVCRMVTTPEVFARSGNVLPRSGSDLMHDYLQTTVDVTVRRWLAESDFQNRSIRYDLLQAGGQWLAALRDRDPALRVRAAALKQLVAGVESWQLILKSGSEDLGEDGFRTCLRLVSPDGAELPPGDELPGGGKLNGVVDGVVDDRAESDWALQFFIQATDDPSLLVPAGEIWNEGGQALKYLQHRFVRPQEKLLADLGLAARLFPPLADGLRMARPTYCRLSTREAYDFLCGGAAILQESGFVVQVPPWWGQTASLGLRLKLGASRDQRNRTRPAVAEGVSGLLGMATVVEYDWELALGEEALSRDEFNQLAALKVPLVRFRGQWVELRPETVRAAAAIAQSKVGSGRMTLAEALRLGLAGGDSGADSVADDAMFPDLDLGDLPVLTAAGEGWLGELMKQLAAGERLNPLPVPADFNGVLRPYQERGFSWLRFLEQRGLGACLADDMGLGKTIQFLAFLLHRREQGLVSGPALLVCPTSVVGNWQREVARFAPGLRVLVHHGPQRERGDDFVRAIAEKDLVLSTYGLVYRDREDLARVGWDGIVLDEAQQIKNPESKQARSVCSLAAGYRLALTGTPVENRLSELWSISNFLNPGYLGTHNWFRESFARPIERYRDPARTTLLRRLVAPFILRRLKADPDVAPDLPEKQEQKVFCHLSVEQGTLYAAVVAEMLDRIAAADGLERRGLILATLSKLKQVCNHPAHFTGDGSSLAGRSGKLNRLDDLLDQVLAVDDRALLFTQFREMGTLLQRYLQHRFGREVLFLHGGTTRRARDEMVARFQSGGGNDDNGGNDDTPSLFILSLKAGGVGLNLTAANHVFHFDRWWNPAVENQATDRAFRIGQQRNVLVHKFVCVGTVEEKIDLMIEEKLNLAAEVIGSGEDRVTELSTVELRELFSLRPGALSGDEE